jgi:hypothetical protein
MLLLRSFPKYLKAEPSLPTTANEQFRGYSYLSKRATTKWEYLR